MKTATVYKQIKEGEIKTLEEVAEILWQDIKKNNKKSNKCKENAKKK